MWRDDALSMTEEERMSGSGSGSLFRADVNQGSGQWDMAWQGME